MYQVYIVDDAVLTRKALVMTMPWDQWGCVVVGSADDGEKAFEDIREMEPDIVITDIRMVHVGGLELMGAAGPRESAPSSLSFPATMNLSTPRRR